MANSTENPVSSTNRRRRPIRSPGILVIAIGIFSAIVTSAMGQTGMDPMNGMIAPLDIYGNAQALHPERRALDVFQNDVQRQMLGAYQAYNRPVSQRGFGTSFALPSDQFMKTLLGRLRPGAAMPSTWQQRPSPFGLQERERKSAFSSYGGFSTRRSPYASGDAEAALTRKRSLIAANSSTAPIERSMFNNGRLGTIRFPVAQTPFQAAQNPTASPTAQNGDADNQESLDKYLVSESQVLHDRAQAEGWKQFRAGDYRGAIRTFESASMLDEKDAESRIGEVFCYVSLGSFRAAFLSLNAIQTRDDNPFRYDFSMTDKFGDIAQAQQVRLLAQGIAEASEQGSEMKALGIHVLWYMGAKDDALRAARALAAKEPNRSFSNWPKLMQAAMIRPPAGVAP